MEKKPYKVKFVVLRHNGEKIGEGGTIELSDKEAKNLEQYLEPIESAADPVPPGAGEALPSREENGGAEADTDHGSDDPNPQDDVGAPVTDATVDDEASAESTEDNKSESDPKTLKKTRTRGKSK